MRFVGMAGAALAALMLLAVVTAGPAAAAGPLTSPVPLAGASTASLGQNANGSWTTTVYVSTDALCQEQTPSFALIMTGSGGRLEEAAGQPSRPLPSGPSCTPAAQAGTPQTLVTLTFCPGLTVARGQAAGGLACPAGGIPQSAVLVVTPPAAESLDPPIQITLTIRRYVSTAQYIWIPVGLGLGLTLLLVIATAVAGGRRAESRRHRRRTWVRRFAQMKLYAASTWSFSDSWATNFTALTTLIAALSTGVGAANGLVPGVDIGRFSLLFILAGGITGFAPLVFGFCNSGYSKPDPLAGGMPSIVADYSAGGTTSPSQELAEITLPAGGAVTLNGAVTPPLPAPDGRSLNPGTTLPLDIGTIIVVRKGERAAGIGDWQPVLVVSGPDDLAVSGYRPFTLSAALDIPASAIAGGPGIAGGAGVLPAGRELLAVDGARLEFHGRADVRVLKGARVEVAAGGPASAGQRLPARSLRRFEIPPSSEVVATRMWVMLLASAFTAFGIGAQVGIVGWVLGVDLAATASWVRYFVIAVMVVTLGLFLGYAVTSILSLIGVPASRTPRRGRATSFML